MNVPTIFGSDGGRGGNVTRVSVIPVAAESVTGWWMEVSVTDDEGDEGEVIEVAVNKVGAGTSVGEVFVPGGETRDTELTLQTV